MSKHRNKATKSDLIAKVQLQKGFARHDGNLRFITLTNVKNMKQWTELKRWMGTKLREYFGVRTAEGGGVIHLVYAGTGVRRADLSKAWKEITGGAWNVHISKVNDYPKVLREMCFQHEKQRYFHSQGWSEAVKTVQQAINDAPVSAYRYSGDRNLCKCKRTRL